MSRRVAPASLSPLEVWGGLECTVVRLHDRYRHQIAETGHAERPEDLDAIAGLGIRTLRYPVLWESIAPDHPQQRHWHWHDQRLNRLRELSIAPVAGLVHHGSGPRYTHLLDPQFPSLLARHAEAVAQRYPWIRHYTPVNEPLTTARFSALYGHWYPHRATVPDMLRALFNQCRGIVLAMAAIRRVRADALLVQTEDLGKVFCTPELQHQAEYENTRRWLSLDLLCGRVGPQHPWYPICLQAGIDKNALHFFLERPCVPDLIGINHYLTSERFLDERVERYPLWVRGAHEMCAYVDVQAVRVAHTAGMTGPQHRLREAWQRYGLPLAITEAHHGGPRDEQLRWLMEMWRAARQLRGEGVDLRAFTVWSMFGCVDWNSLLTQENGYYESGPFDVRCHPPRPTALARATAALVDRGDFDHPVLDQPGWWRREGRFLHESTGKELPMHCHTAARRLLITGGNGALGQAFARICAERGIACDLLGRDQLDIADPRAVDVVLALRRPWAIVNAAGYGCVERGEREPARCYRDNALGAEILARACARLKIPYVTFSSGLVFDGLGGRPYVESDSVSPAGVYGLSKAAAERRVMDAWPEALVVRSCGFFGPWNRRNFAHDTLHALARGGEVRASEAPLVSPTYVPDLVHAALDLLIDGEQGVWHLANQSAISWHGFALMLAQEAGVSADSLVCVEAAQAGPSRMLALGSERGLILPRLDHAVRRYLLDSGNDWRREPAAA